MTHEAEPTTFELRLPGSRRCRYHDHFSFRGGGSQQHLEKGSLRLVRGSLRLVREVRLELAHCARALLLPWHLAVLSFAHWALAPAMLLTPSGLLLQLLQTVEGLHGIYY